MNKVERPLLTAQLRRLAKRFAFVPVKRLRANAEIARYLAHNPFRRLNIGAGGNRVPGWLNLDLSPAPGATFMDASRRWPFDDKSIDLILCEHMVEHVPKALAEHMLREMQRVLRLTGKVRIVTPDLDWLAATLTRGVSNAELPYVRFLERFFQTSNLSWCDVVNLQFYSHAHRYLWSIHELSRAVERAGFDELVVTRAGNPHDGAFIGTEGHPKLVGYELDALEAFAIEASPRAQARLNSAASSEPRRRGARA